jgi:hypothetical protein
MPRHNTTIWLPIGRIRSRDSDCSQMPAPRLRPRHPQAFPFNKRPVFFRHGVPPGKIVPCQTQTAGPVFWLVGRPCDFHGRPSGAFLRSISSAWALARVPGARRPSHRDGFVRRWPARRRDHRQSAGGDWCLAAVASIPHCRTRQRRRRLDTRIRSWHSAIIIQRASAATRRGGPETQAVGRGSIPSFSSGSCRARATPAKSSSRLRKRFQTPRGFP